MSILVDDSNKTACRAAEAGLQQKNCAALVRPAGTGKGCIVWELLDAHPEMRVLWVVSCAARLELRRALTKRLGRTLGGRVRLMSCEQLAVQNALGWVALAEFRPGLLVLDGWREMSAKDWTDCVQPLFRLCPGAKLLALGEPDAPGDSCRAAEEMLGRSIPIGGSENYDTLFSDIAPLQGVLAVEQPGYLDGERDVGGRSLELLLTPFDQVRLGGVLVVIHDVTEQRKTEELRREFVANVAHELRTPLTNIRSYAETLTEGAGDIPPAMEKKFLGVILNESDRMTHIVQDLLTLSRFDSGRDDLKLARFSFEAAVQDLYNAVYMEAQRHSHTLELELEDGLPEVTADRERTVQVMMNIVSNSIKYTPDGGKIVISAGRTGDRVWMQVDDNGIGIPPEDRPRIFERFYQGSKKEGSTGLGLALVNAVGRYYGLRVAYRFESGRHVFSVAWP